LMRKDTPTPALNWGLPGAEQYLSGRVRRTKTLCVVCQVILQYQVKTVVNIYL